MNRIDLKRSNNSVFSLRNFQGYRICKGKKKKGLTLIIKSQDSAHFIELF